MTWIMTGLGRRIDFINPDPEQISLVDIGIALSRVPRFGGHSPMKVGQHDVEVAALAIRKLLEDNPQATNQEIGELGVASLLHDFPEYVVGDCPTPFKRILGAAYEKCESAILNAMLRKWGISDIYAKWYPTYVSWADRSAVQQEAVRFKMDGWIVDEFAETITQVPRAWVPDDVVVNLYSELWHEHHIATILTTLFFRFMYMAGRWDNLEEGWRTSTEQGAKEAGMSLEQFVMDPMGIRMFTDTDRIIF